MDGRDRKAVANAQQRGPDIGDVDAPAPVAWTRRTLRLARTTPNAGWTSCLGLRLIVFFLEHPDLQSTSCGRTPAGLPSGYRRAWRPSLAGATLELRIISLSCNGRRRSCLMPEFFAMMSRPFRRLSCLCPKRMGSCDCAWTIASSIRRWFGIKSRLVCIQPPRTPGRGITTIFCAFLLLYISIRAFWASSASCTCLFCACLFCVFLFYAFLLCVCCILCKTSAGQDTRCYVEVQSAIRLLSAPQGSKKACLPGDGV